MEGAPCIDVGGDVAPRVGTSANQCLRRPFGETSLRYAPHPGAPHTGNMDPGQLGNVLPNGEDYRPHEMQAMMELLWAEYVDANPRLFGVYDWKAPRRGVAHAIFLHEAQQSTNSPHRRSAGLLGRRCKRC